MRENSSRIRSREMMLRFAAYFLTAPSVGSSMCQFEDADCFSGVRSSLAKRMARMMRRASSSKRCSGLPTARMTFFSISAKPPNGSMRESSEMAVDLVSSDGVHRSTDAASALMVKSRRARSSASVVTKVTRSGRL